MKKIYLLNQLFWALMLLSVEIGCHQDPLIPKSAIPKTCQISELITVNENQRDTTTYVYNTFGNVEKCTYRKWINGQLSVSIDQNYFFSADHFLNSQIDKTTTRTTTGTLAQEAKGYIYTYSPDTDSRLQQIKINNYLTGVTTGFIDYIYEGDKIKTYTETDANKALIRRYTFDVSGKLTKFEEPNSKIYSVITNGKITQRTYPDSTIINYEFDSQGQLGKQTIISPAGKSQYTYTYDNNPYWTKTQLQLRGIPAPDLGDNVQIHNLKVLTYQRYQNDKLLGEQKLTYSHIYTKSGYSQGYSRSDGIRQYNYYNNCQ